MLKYIAAFEKQEANGGDERGPMEDYYELKAAKAELDSIRGLSKRTKETKMGEKKDAARKVFEDSVESSRKVFHEAQRVARDVFEEAYLAAQKAFDEVDPNS